MASSQQRSPATPATIPKRSFPSFSVRRPSLSSATPSTTQPRTSFSSISTISAVAASPSSYNAPNINQNGSSPSAGMPSFRSLRNLLPFGPPKQPNNVASTSSRSPFSGFGRRSVTINRHKEHERGRKASLSDDAYMPVISIERSPSHVQDEPLLRRSISLPRLKGSLDRPDEDSSNQPFNLTTAVPTLRTPSPGPPLLAELSTIIEVDSSGISKHVPLLTPSTESSHSLSPPSSPSQDDLEEHTVRRPPVPPLTTPLMTASTPLTPSTPSQHPSAPSTDADASTSTDVDLELSTSQLVSQVKDAMARTSWGNNDKAIIIDADASFLHNDDPQEADMNISGEDDNASLLAIVDVRLNSSSPTSELGSDSLSHMNNSLSSVINPNHLQMEEDATLDLSSLDPDLRAAVSDSITHYSSTFPQLESPSPPVYSSMSAGTIVPSSPTLRSPQQDTPRSISSSSVAQETSSILAPLGKPQSPIGGPLQPKRRVVSSFLPRLRPIPPHSTTSSASNTPSPRKTSFDSVPKRNIRADAPPSAYAYGGPGTRLSPQPQLGTSGVFTPPSAQGRPPPAEFGNETQDKEEQGAQKMNHSSVPALTSTPVKMKTRKVVGDHTRKSSVPIASWRQKERGGVGHRSGEADEEDVQVSLVGPEVRVLEASAEISPNALGNNNSPNLADSGRWRDGSPAFSPEPYRKQDRHDDKGGNALGSPFHTPGERDESEGKGWLGVRNWVGNALNSGAGLSPPGQRSSPSHSPSPSPITVPSTLRPSTTQMSTTNKASPVPSGLTLSPSPNPHLPSQNLIPSPITPSSSTTSGNDEEGDGKISPEDEINLGSLSGRSSRKILAPLRLFWGGAGSGNGSGVEDRVERQPSPLRSVVGADGSTKENNHGVVTREGDTGRVGSRIGGSRRASLEELVAPELESVRPSMESSRPSMDSYVSSSVPASTPLRYSPDPRYQRNSLELSRSLVPENFPPRPPTSLTERDDFLRRSRKRSLSMQGNSSGEFRPSDIVGRNGVGNTASTTLSARERLARARYGDLGGGSRPWSSMSMRSGRIESMSVVSSRTDWLTPKGTGRHIRGTGLTEYERERSPGLGGIERSISERTGEREREGESQYRDRSGSASALPGIGTLGRYASLRSASEYNFGGSTVNLSMQHHQTTYPRSSSRMTYSESGGSGGSGHGRRGSEAFSIANSGLTESPTFTVSTSASGSRDTAKTASTAATSVSMGGLAHAGVKEREREREELREMREKHAVETGALLSALSDSQRTCRVLREENGELREKLADVEAENGRLRSIIGEVEGEIERLKVSRERERELEKERQWERQKVLGRELSPIAGSGTTRWRGLATPLAKQRDLALGSRTIPRMSKWERGHERERDGFYEDKQLTAKNLRSKLDTVLFTGDADLEPQHQRPLSVQEEDSDSQVDVEENGEETIASTSTLPTHRRRPSATSSIFPVPPSNMTMLLHDETAFPPDSNRSSADLFSLNGFKMAASPLPIPRSLMQGHTLNSSVSSNVSVSPTENFSMVTGSPGSLSLKPEHEMLLGEMESLDLGQNEQSEAETWSD